MLSDHDLLAFMYTAFNARAADTVLATLHPEVDWPNGMEGGRVLGRDAVRAYWTQQWSMISPHVEPTGFETLPDGRIRVRVHQVVRDLGGQLLADQTVHHVYTLENGLVRRMDIKEG